MSAYFHHRAHKRDHFSEHGPTNSTITWHFLLREIEGQDNTPCNKWLLPFSHSFPVLFFVFSPCSHRRFVGSISPSADSIQSGGRHASADLRGVTNHHAAHTLVGGLVPSLSRGRHRPASGARHLVKGLRSTLGRTVSAEDGGRGPQARQNNRYELQADHSQAAAGRPGPVVLPGRWVDPGYRWKLVCNDAQAKWQDAATNSAHGWGKTSDDKVNDVNKTKTKKRLTSNSLDWNL